VSGIAYDLFTAAFGQPNLAPPETIEALLRQAVAEVEGHRFALRFLIGEWRDVVDAWQLRQWEEYRNVARLGRKTRTAARSVKSCGRFSNARAPASPSGASSPGPLYSTASTA
jgi:hypothetical protein